MGAANNIAATLSIAATSTDVTLTLQTGQGAKFAVGYAILYVSGNIELVSVTSIAGDVLNVTRAQGGTVAAAWPIGSSITQGATATGLTNMMTTPVTNFKAGSTAMIGDAYSGFGNPTANLHVVQKSWIDANYYPASQSYQPALGYTPITKYWETGHSISIGWNGNLYLYVDGLYEGIFWTSANFNPGSKAAAGAQCPWASGIWEVGKANTVNPGDWGTIDAGAPWCVEGLRTLNNGDYQPYIRAVWLRNQ